MVKNRSGGADWKHYPYRSCRRWNEALFDTDQAFFDGTFPLECRGLSSPETDNVCGTKRLPAKEMSSEMLSKYGLGCRESSSRGRRFKSFLSLQGVRWRMGDAGNLGICLNASAAPATSILLLRVSTKSSISYKLQGRYGA